MNSINLRIKELIEKKNMSIREFERSINSTNGVIARIVREGKDFSYSVVENILQVHTDVNPVWLISGIGNVFIESNLNDDNHTFLTKNDGENLHKSELGDAKKTGVILNDNNHTENLKTSRENVPQNVPQNVPLKNKNAESNELEVLLERVRHLEDKLSLKDEVIQGLRENVRMYRLMIGMREEKGGNLEGSALGSEG